MVPFMFMQSAAMALGFGSFFQYGKRKISSMSNEEFNALTPEALTSQLLTNVNNMIPTVQQSFQQMEQMNVMILEAMSKYFSQGIEFLDKWITGRGQQFITNVQSGIVDPITSAQGEIDQAIIDFGENFTILPPAFADTTLPVDPQKVDKKYSAIEQYASRWMDPSTGKANYTMTQKEGLYILKQMSKGTLNLFKIFRTGLLRYVDSLNPKKLTAQEQLDKEKAAIDKTATGWIKEIATRTALIKKELITLNQMKKNTPRSRTQIKLLSTLMTSYNRYVQSNRQINNKLVIDTYRTILAEHINYKR